MAKKDQMAENRQAIVNLLVNKAALKQDIAEDVKEVFAMFKRVIGEELSSLKEKVNDPRIRLFHKEIGHLQLFGSVIHSEQGSRRGVSHC
ncbi:MAG: hypothetical protein LW688_11405 [Cryomorphaceae bacterium]|nr:hypothetical protein [Cryomorphaceae bacterium]